MNLLSNGYIWLLPGRAASRTTYDTLKLNGIDVVKTNGYVPPFSRQYTHEINVPEEHLNKPIIMNVRNPYFQVFSLWRLAQTVAVRPFATTNNPFPDTLDKLPIWFDEVKNGEDGTNAVKTYLTLPPQCLTFSEWLKCTTESTLDLSKEPDHVVQLEYLRKFSRSSLPYNLPAKDPDYVVHIENYKEDMLKIPFIKKLSTSNPCTAQYGSTILKYVALNLALSDEYNTDYFVKFIESNTKVFNALFKVTPKTYPQVQLKKLYQQLKEIPDDKLKTFLRNFLIVPEGFKEKMKLIDLYTLFSDDWKSFYTQELADIVYNGRPEWFTKFGYDKDSWK